MNCVPHRFLLAAVSVFGLTFVLACAQSRAGVWLPPTPLNSSTGSAPAVGIDAAGNTTVIWQTNPSANPDVIQGARHDAGASGFHQLTDLASDPVPPLNNTQPTIAVNASGNGLAVWVHDTGIASMTDVDYRTISPGGALGQIQTLSSMSAVGYGHPVAAINSSGAAVVAWEASGSTVYAASRPSLGGAFVNSSAPLSMSATGAPSVAIDNAGHVLAIWADGAFHNLAYERAAAGGSWPAPTSQTLQDGGHTLTDQSLASTASGQLLVAFQDTTVNTVVSEASGTIAGGFGATPTIKTISDIGVSHGPSATIADNGAAVVGWTQGSAVKFSRRPAGGGFPGPAGAQSISTLPGSSFSLAGNGRGEVVAAWYAFEMPPGFNLVRAAVMAPGASSFGASKVISSPSVNSYDHVIMLDPFGDAVVGIPLGSSGGPTGVSVAVYDAGPRISGPTGPHTVKLGTLATFKASASDPFSPVTKLTWSFGGSGEQVSHKFTVPGTVTITVTATDAAGVKNTASLRITVKPPANRCVVPKLKGKTLSQAKGALHKAHCTLGKVTKPRRPKHRKLRKLVVKSSKPKAGTVLRKGAKVRLTLAEVPKKHK